MNSLCSQMIYDHKIRMKMETLPNELIEYILCFKQLSYSDVVKCRNVSKRFANLINNNQQIWKCKFKQKWNLLYDAIESNDWHNELIQRHRYGQSIERELSKMSQLYYYDDELSMDAFRNFLDYKRDENPHVNGQLFQIDHLESILNDGDNHKNLTVKYYAEKVLRFLRHEMIKEQLKMIETNDLFYGAILISLWGQNVTIDVHHYRRQIELIALLTIDLIKEKFQFDCTMNETTLTDNLWSLEQCRQILYCLNEVMFVELKFAGNRDNYYDARNSFIDKVIDTRKGIPITLCILYQTIAAKLGVKTYPVNFPGHFLLKWKQYPNLKGNDRFTYIDVFENGRNMNHSDDESGDCPSVDVYRRMCRNLIEVGRQNEISSEGLLCLRNALELLCILSPEEIEPRLLLSRVYIHLNINLDEVNRMLQYIVERDPTSTGIVTFLQHNVQSQMKAKQRKKVIKLRTPEVQFTIGMRMRHKKYNYECVIYGWDPKCSASKDWIYQMGVHNLPNKDKQPFYNVLVEDGSTRYAAQENLELSKNCKHVSHPEIGKYFQEFSDGYYRPNDEKSGEYPEDEHIRRTFL